MVISVSMSFARGKIEPGVSVMLVICCAAVSVLGCGVRFSVMLFCAVPLLFWNVGPS